MSAGKHLLSAKELTAAASHLAEENDVLTPHAQKLIADLYTLFRHRIGPALVSGSGDDAFWLSIVLDMMVVAGKSRVNGRQKKAALLEVLKLVIHNEVSPNSRNAAHAIVDTVISPGIDLAVAFSKASKGCQKWCCC